MRVVQVAVSGAVCLPPRCWPHPVTSTTHGPGANKPFAIQLAVRPLGWSKRDISKRPSDGYQDVSSGSDIRDVPSPRDGR